MRLPPAVPAAEEQGPLTSSVVVGACWQETPENSQTSCCHQCGAEWAARSVCPLSIYTWEEARASRPCPAVCVLPGQHCYVEIIRTGVGAGCPCIHVYTHAYRYTQKGF